MTWLGTLVRDTGALFVGLFIGIWRWEREKVGYGTRNLAFLILIPLPPQTHTHTHSMAWEGKPFFTKLMVALI